MKKIKTVLLIILCNFSFVLVAQESNVFLDKKFWESKPNLTDIKQKIAEGHSPSALSPFGFDAVTSSLFAKADEGIVKHLLSFKENVVNKLTHDGRTYIFWAAYMGNLNIMQYLLDKGAKTNIIDDKGYSLLTFAAVTGQKDPKLYDFIIENGANVKTEKSKEGANVLLLLIPHLSDFTLVNYFESKGINLLDKDNYGNGAFNYTARTGNIKMLKKLIIKGVDYTTINKKGGNAFIFASQGTRRKTNGLNVYSFLDSLGINPNVTNSEGVNPLHNIAYEAKEIEIFTYFLDKGVDIEAKDKNGNTPFMNAASYNNLEIINYLLPFVKNINSTNKKGQTALSNAMATNTTEIVSRLIKKGADINVLDKQGNNLGYYLINTFQSSKKQAFFDKAKLLENKGLNFNLQQAEKNTLYHIAIEKLDLELLKFLSKYHIDINKANSEGLTVLHIASMKAKDATILKYLLNNGADKKLLTLFGESAYDLATENELLKNNNIDLEFLK